jgi:hypothetical protein
MLFGEDSALDPKGNMCFMPLPQLKYVSAPHAA